MQVVQFLFIIPQLAMLIKPFPALQCLLHANFLLRTLKLPLRIMKS